MSSPGPRESLLSTVLESYRDEYKEIVDTWRNLEAKAQANVAIAGIFIAGAFAYLRENAVPMHLYQKILLSSGIICLIITIGFSIVALRVRRLPAPPLGDYIDRLVRDLLEVDNDEIIERMPHFMNDQIAGWRIVRNEYVKSNQLKAKFLWIGQILLVAAILAVGVLTLSRILF